MYNSFDLGAVVLYLIFGSVLAYLVYLLFDVRGLPGTETGHEYVDGYPEDREFRPSEGILEVNGDEISFRDLDGEKVYFSIPLGRINNVSTAREGSGSAGRVFDGITNMFAERDYLFIDFFTGSEERKIRFSTHRASSANEKIIKEIQEARKRTTGEKAL